MDGQDRFATFKISTLTLNSIYILIKIIANLNNLTIQLCEKIFGKKQNIKHFPKSVRNVEWIK